MKWIKSFCILALAVSGQAQTSVSEEAVARRKAEIKADNARWDERKKLGEALRSGHVGEVITARARLRSLKEAGTDEEIWMFLDLMGQPEAEISDFKPWLYDRLSKTTSQGFAMSAFELIPEMKPTTQDLASLVNMTPAFNERVNGTPRNFTCGTGVLRMETELILPVLRELGPGAFSILKHGSMSDPISHFRHPDFIRAQLDGMRREPEKKLGVAGWLADSLLRIPFRMAQPARPSSTPTEISPELSKLKAEFIDALFDLAVNPPQLTDGIALNNSGETPREYILRCMVDYARFDPKLLARVRQFFAQNPQWRALMNDSTSCFYLETLMGD